MKTPSHTQNDSVTRLMVVGFPRSGTTLISQHIAQSLGLLCFPETHFLSQYFLGNTVKRFRSRISRKQNHSWVEFQKIYGRYPKQGLGINLNFSTEVKRYFSYLDKIVQGDHSQYYGWLEKTPKHLEIAGKVLTNFSNVFVIAIIRDPLDAISSYLDVTAKYPEEWGGQKSFLASQARWRKYAEIILNCESNSRFMTIRYEDFIDNPQGTIEGVCDKFCIKANSVQNLAPVYDFETWKGNNRSLEILQRKSKRDVVMSASEIEYCIENLLPLYKKFANEQKSFASNLELKL